MNSSRALRILSAVARRPGLWGIALRQALRLAPPGWWHRFPFLPLPDAKYARMRAVIQYGDENHPADVADVLKYLAWCKAELAPRPTEGSLL